MKQVIERIKQNQFLDFKGAQLYLKIPLPEPLLNAAVKANLQGESIEKLTMTVLPDNVLEVQVNATVKLIFKAKISRTIKVKLQESVAVDDQFNTIAEIESIEGGLGKTEEAIIQMLSKKINKDLPPYIRFSGDDLKINAYRLLVDYGLEYAVDFIDKLYISTDTTDTGKIWIEGTANI